MKKLEELVPVIILILSFIFVIRTICNESILLENIYIHKMQKNAQIEVAKLLFYFDKMPIITHTATQINLNKMEHSFLLSNVQLEKKLEDMIAQLDMNNQLYTCNIEHVGPLGINGKQDITIRFTFDPDIISIDYDTFDAITQKKVIVFYLFNKNALEKIQQDNKKSLLQISFNKKNPIICIDCGHGGTDFGAVGYGGILEKNVCLSLGKQVETLLKKNHYEVILTRDDDRYVSFADRVEKAHTYNADVFVSIHANSVLNTSVAGVETYCVNPIFFTSGSIEANNQYKIFEKNRFEKSFQLACNIHNSICDHIKLQNPYFKDRKVKHGAAQVLVGVQVPAVLIEVGFISHPVESQLLTSHSYQDILTQGIVAGIKKFVA